MTAEELVERVKAACPKDKMHAIDWAGLLAKIKALTPTVLAIIETIVTLLTTSPTPGPTPAQK